MVWKRRVHATGRRACDVLIIQGQGLSLRVAQGKRNGGQLGARRYACSVGWRWGVEEPRPGERGMRVVFHRSISDIALIHKTVLTLRADFHG
jgi:hypothetical protein